MTRRLTVDTDLTWEASADPAVAGYEVVWRATTEPVWTHARRLGLVTSCTLTGISKDNYFFGVRAIDRDGRLSPVSFAWPLQ